ncbi:uncharacterized protein BJ212DRAFT_1450139 [Suillus subaureus]|uniref:Uncharacterized protein n=1 Tax=Suillus subaureus TaxID=48587 RepID=A0A9P7DQH0_9AGAM|nr:uncharacterized protein BJ212DRAFT_1450139 [Suillus subaureus]KAG1800682.1 hypothetical protein BJ212DRAFT_1450139 [Suillus subaureus]
MNDTRSHSHFGAPLLNHTANPPSLLKSYRRDLTPCPSHLHPHLQLAAAPAETQDSKITYAQLEHILDVMGLSWAQLTKETYVGLLVFHVFCNMNSITEDQRCPVNPMLLLSFLSSCAGSHSGLALANFTVAIRAWHLLHGRLWLISHSELKTLLKGAKAVAPEHPIIHPQPLNLNEPLDAAIFACLMTSFYCIAQLGEFTVKTIKGFNPKKHISRAGVSESTDQHGFLFLLHNGNPITKFHIPSTKTYTTTGEDTFWATQDGLSDPRAVLINHFCMNPAHDDALLFAWRYHKGIQPLSKAELVKRVATVTVTTNLPNLKGHGLHIRGTLEYLLWEIPFDIVKSMGRWSSDTFTLYLRDHTLILAPPLSMTLTAPYMQALSVLEPFTCYTQPPMR